MVADGLRGEFTRRILAPMAISIMNRFALTRHAAFRVLSQTHIHYDDSPLSEGEAGHVHGGDRLRWTGGSGIDNFAPLTSRDWQVHVYDGAEAGLDAACSEVGLKLHALAWDDAARDAGFKLGATYLVRPDGYVALAVSSGGVERLRAYIDRLSLRFS
jgi:hypothetical protein